MQLRHVGLVAALIAGSAIGAATGVRAAEPETPAIGAAASGVLQEMNKTLLSKEFSFKAQTTRVYQDESGDFLHIVHNLNVVVRRPDRLAVKATGDDGKTELLYNGKTATVFNVDRKKYAQVAAPGKLPAMLDELADRLHVDFPLADLVTDEPGKSFLTGVTSGKEVNTVTIDGIPCRHLFFTQAGGIELELWVQTSQPAVPRRLIVTYRALPGQPNFVAEFSNWNFSTHPSDAEFDFQPPAGATKVELASAAEQVPGATGEK
jgi:hypothetical protein